MSDMSDLSPQAQAILKAYETTIGYRRGFAAILEAVVAKTAATCIPRKSNAAAMHRNQVVIITSRHGGLLFPLTTGAGSGCSDEHRALHYVRLWLPVGVDLLSDSGRSATSYYPPQAAQRPLRLAELALSGKIKELGGVGYSCPALIGGQQ